MGTVIDTDWWDYRELLTDVFSMVDPDVILGDVNHLGWYGMYQVLDVKEAWQIWCNIRLNLTPDQCVKLEQGSNWKHLVGHWTLVINSDGIKTLNRHYTVQAARAAWEPVEAAYEELYSRENLDV